MSRYFAIQSWVSSHDNEPDYSGQQTGSRHVRSVEIPMYTQHGKANVDWFSDEQIALRNGANKPKVNIKDKILPQFKRLTTLREQMIELETSYRAGEMNISEYSLYRDIIVAKIQRQEVLYKRAASVKPKSSETDEDSAQDGLEYTPFSGFSPQDDDGYTSEEYVDCGVEFIDQLSNGNSFKKILQRGCKGVRTLVRWHQATRNYINELKAI